jgi:uncharacterized protein YkwD
VQASDAGHAETLRCTGDHHGQGPEHARRWRIRARPASPEPIELDEGRSLKALGRRALLGGLLLWPASRHEAWAQAGSQRSASGAPAPDLQAVRTDVFDRANQYRSQQGRAPVRLQDALQGAAQSFADFLARSDRFEHEADGRRPDQRATAAGYDWCRVSENIGFAASSDGFRAEALAARLMNGWIQSAGHRQNLLATEALDTGIGVAHSPASGRYYGVQMFGRSGDDCRPRRR